MISCLHRWPVHFYSEDRPFSSAIAAEVDCYIDCSGLYDRAGEGSRIVTGWLTTLPALVQWSFVNSENTEVHFKMPSILVKLPLFKIHTGDLSSKHLCEDSSEISTTSRYFCHTADLAFVYLLHVWTQTRAKNMRKWNIHRVSDACLSLFYSP